MDHLYWAGVVLVLVGVANYLIFISIGSALLLPRNAYAELLLWQGYQGGACLIAAGMLMSHWSEEQTPGFWPWWDTDNDMVDDLNLWAAYVQTPGWRKHAIRWRRNLTRRRRGTRAPAGNWLNTGPRVASGPPLLDALEDRFPGITQAMNDLDDPATDEARIVEIGFGPAAELSHIRTLVGAHPHCPDWLSVMMALRDT